MIFRCRWLGLLALALLGTAVPAAHAEEFFFKDGDRVVMLGDSITEQYLYSTYVEAWTITRFPEWKLTFRNTGIGGDTSPGGNGRFKRDVLRYDPTALTVDFGMNDGGYGSFNEGRFQAYYKGLQGIADQAKTAKIRVAWITPQPLDTGEQGKTEPNTYNKTLEQFSMEGVKDIAAKNDGLFVDQFHPYLAVLNKARGETEKYSPIAYTPGKGGDAVHPAPPGQALMAASILKGMNFPTLVSTVEVDAGKGEVVKAGKCKVTDIEKKEGGLRFQRQDEALPFFPPKAESILKWAPIRDELNDYGLKVTGLKSGRYEVRLGGKTVAEHSAEELAKGVNLTQDALAKGPVADQVKAVWEAVQAKNDYFHNQIFRGVVLGKVPEDKREDTFKERMRKMPELDEAIRKALVMKPHEVEIVPVEK